MPSHDIPIRPEIKVTVSESRESIRWFATVLGTALVLGGAALGFAGFLLRSSSTYEFAAGVAFAFSAAAIVVGAVLAFAGKMPVDDRP